MTQAEKEQRALKMLQEAAKQRGYDLDSLPDLSTHEGFAAARQAYAKSTRSSLEQVDRLVAMSKAGSYSRMYRV